MKTKTIFTIAILIALVRSNVCVAQIDVASTGKVGINNSSPQRLLVVSDAGTEGTEIQPFTGYTQIISYNRSNSTYVPLVLQDPSVNGGYVGIGITNPSYRLELGYNSAAKPTSSTWTTTSDSRTKTNIADYNRGLNLIRQVQIVSYEYNGLAHTPAGEKGIGVIAQDFQNIFPNSVKPYLCKNDSTSENETYFGVDLHELFVTNVRAVQQLDSIVQVQNTRIDELESQLTSCCNRSFQENGNTSNTNNNGQIVNNSELTSTTASLYQNVPNPFNQQTKIEYFIPTTSKSASIMIFDLNGKLMSTLTVTNFEKGYVMVSRGQLSPGMFVYSLVVDGKIIDTKRMILTN